MKKIRRLKFLDDVSLELLDKSRTLPEHEARGRKALGVAPHGIQMRRIGKVVDIARPTTVVVGEKQHVPIVVYKTPAREVNRRNGVEMAQEKHLVGQNVRKQQTQS